MMGKSYSHTTRRCEDKNLSCVSKRSETITQGERSLRSCMEILGQKVYQSPSDE